MVARVVTQAIGGKVRGKRHGPEGSEVRITAQTNELMNDVKYQTIHMSHVGSILQITLIRNNVFKSTYTLIRIKDGWQPRQIMVHDTTTLFPKSYHILQLKHENRFCIKTIILPRSKRKGSKRPRIRIISKIQIPHFQDQSCPKPVWLSNLILA
jgi:hypothetical protein